MATGNSGTIASSSARFKLRRAGHLLESLQTDLATLSDVERYGIVDDLDSATNTRRYRFGNVPAKPDDLELRIGEALYNYRCALDHLVWELVLSEGNTPSDKNEFPIFDDATSYARGRTARLHGVSAPAAAIIDSLQPCNSVPPNDYWWYLWYLHALNNADKHRQLLLARQVIPRVALGWFGTEASLPPTIGRIAPSVVSHEVFLSVAPRPEHNDLTLRVTIGLYFSEPPPGVRKDIPVDSVLTLIDNAVREVFRRLTQFLQ